MTLGTGYALVICEKPDAARRISDALSGGAYRSEQVEGTTVYRFDRRGEEFVVCSAQGHVYGLSDPSDERTVYPVFDVEWYPSNLLDERSAGAARKIAAVKKLAASAAKLVNACDYDVEGETIGYNVLRYACGGMEKRALRAKFSTLTEEDLVKAFDALERPGTDGLARAGRARHAIDFVWGVNLSRALSQSALGSGHRYRTVSMGRVQGPTLGFLVQREREIREFVPTPYWKVVGTFERDGKEFTAGYATEKVETRALATQVRDDCVGKEGVAKMVRRSTVQVAPPAPFNVGDLQKEAYRAFRYPPSKTLQVAERLYLDALISYPRTGSQRIPPSIGYRNILEGVAKAPAYSASAAEILRGDLKPVQGAKADPAHPAIYPTGERPRKALGSAEAGLFDLIVRRFLAAFGAPARREQVEVTLAVGEHEFRLGGGRTVFPGWMSYYGRYAGYRDVELPPLSEGDRSRVSGVMVDERFEARPPRYNQSTLLEKMERESIGTKATRADIVATLVGRGYVAGEGMEVTYLGLSVLETMAEYAPAIISTSLTREIEEELGAVEGGAEKEGSLMRETVRTLARQLAELGASEEAVGKEIDSALMSSAARSAVLGGCPVCRTGQLRVVRSKSSKKRFVGCSNYPACRASGPLPQRGTVKATTGKCFRCRWPVAFIVGSGRPWRLCLNPACPGKKKP